MTTVDPVATRDDSGATAGSRVGGIQIEDLAFVLFGHSAFQYLNASCELGLFEFVASQDAAGADRETIRDGLGLAERAVDVLLLGATSLGMLTRADDRYRVAPTIAEMLPTADWQRFKDTVAFEQYVVYEGIGDFTESLRRNANVGLRRVRGVGRDLYHRLSENPHMETVFYRYMRSWSELANRHLVEQLDLSGVRRLLDCGGGDAVNAVELARANPALQVSVLEIGPTARIAEKRITDAGLPDRVCVVVGDMFDDPFPQGHDCVLFAHQLVIWTLEQNTELLRKAYDALPPGGQVVIFNSMSNDEGDGPLVAALDSVYFASLPAEGGMIYSWRQHEECLREAGFTQTQRIRCPGWTPHGIMVGIK
jgi:ubiquinone/menaquinone biosynthesis C-methylase UbiE